MKRITEEMKIHEEWYKEAKIQTIETLPTFIKSLLSDYQHDYGTICHALTAGAIGTMWAMNHHPQGGITGFQAGCIMWEFIRRWNYENNKIGMKLLNYDDLLYPQYADKFENTISENCFKDLQKEAIKKLEENEKAKEEYKEKLKQYEIDLTTFISKYPDYLQNKKYYDRLGMGTSAEWEEERKKKESGFEFAPDKPYNPEIHPNVFRHWKNIANGILPFNFTIKED